MDTRAWLVAAAAACTVVSGSSDPTAELATSYSLPEIGVLLSAAYANYGGMDLVGSTLYGVKVYTVSYSTGLAGSSTPGAERDLALTGILVVPNRKSSSMHVAGFLHGTTTASAEVPSNAFSSCTSTGISSSFVASSSDEWKLGAGTASTCVPDTSKGAAAVFGALAAASMGYVSILPDYIGYGGSSGTPASYLIAEDYAIATFNLRAAAATLVPALQEGGGIGSTFVAAGYSEGGYAALALHRESQDSRWAEAGINFAASFPAAGPYDLKTTEVDTKLSNPAAVVRPAYTLYVVYSYGVNLLGLDSLVAASFVGSMQQWYDGSNVATDIDPLIMSATGGDFIDVFNATLVNELYADRPTAFTGALEQNTLVEGWVPHAGAGIHLCHSITDEIVNITNAQLVRDAMQAAGAMVDLTTISSGSCTGHVDCAPLCLKHALRGLWENEGKWSGALQNDGGMSDTAVVGAVIGASLAVGGVVYAWTKVRGGHNNYDMIA